VSIATTSPVWPETAYVLLSPGCEIEPFAVCPHASGVAQLCSVSDRTTRFSE
jgi:hypothetical protein